MLILFVKNKDMLPCVMYFGRYTSCFLCILSRISCEETVIQFHPHSRFHRVS